MSTPVKTEDQSPAATPAAPYSIPQWANSHITIDPALQQQAQSTAYAHYSYGSHYPQASYAAYTQAYTPAAQRPSGQSSGADSSDLATLTDALGSAGVDLRAEEESLQRSHEQQRTLTTFEDRTRKQPGKPSFDARFLGATMRIVGTKHKLTAVQQDAVTYMALALRARLQELITLMISAAQHRTDTQFDRPASLYSDNTPMWSIVVRSDVGRQLAALERAEREEEGRVRRERKERLDATQAAAPTPPASVDPSDDADMGGPKKKRKKEGPGVMARNMSEDVRKKMSNAVATQAAGLSKYAWMNVANAPSPPKLRPAPTPTPSTPPAAPSASTPQASAATVATATSTQTSSWARPYVSSKKAPQNQATEEDNRTAITLRDALFVIEKERGHGGGQGAAKAWV